MNIVFCVFEEEWSHEGTWIRLQAIFRDEQAAISEAHNLRAARAQASRANSSSAGVTYYHQTWNLK